MAYKQAEIRRKKLLKTYKATKHSYGSGVFYDEDRNFYHRCPASNTPGYTKFLKRISNKKVRKCDNLGMHNNYRRNFDYKWELF